MQTGHLKMGLGCPFDLCGLSWTAPGAFVDCPRLLFGPLWAVPGTSRGLCGRSWAAPGASVGGPGLLLGPQLAVLGCPWPLCGRSLGTPGRKAALSRAGAGSRPPEARRSPPKAPVSLAALGACVGGLEPKNVKNVATLKMSLFLERERDLRPGGRSGAALRAYVGGLGPLLEPMLAVLGGS